MKKIEIIAEIGWNHMGNMNLAEDMIYAAKKSGADYAKFQTWSVKRLKSGPWDKDGRREIYEKAELSKADHFKLKELCDKEGIKFMSSVFSIHDAKLLAEVQTECVKIPSFESRNMKLINYCREHFDKIFISFGTATKDEILKTINCFTIKERMSGKLVPMHCVSAYPLKAENANLNRINLIQVMMGPQTDNQQYGYSDHMQGVDSAMIALEHGVTVIEKHFTTDQSLPGRDNKFACLPRDIARLKRYIELRDAMNSHLKADYQDVESESRKIYTGRFDG